jgi:hypothetical protein
VQYIQRAAGTIRRDVVDLDGDRADLESIERAYDVARAVALAGDRAWIRREVLGHYLDVARTESVDGWALTIVLNAALDEEKRTLIAHVDRLADEEE